MSRVARSRWLLLAMLLALGCATARLEQTPAAQAVVSPHEAALRHRVDGFYLRLAHRRFNTVETYNDRIMREHFQDANLFLDYYADLAQSLADAHFEKRRPLSIEVLGLEFETAEEAQVRVRFVGADRRPMRPGSVDTVREDSESR